MEEYANSTVINPIGLGILLVLGVALISVRKKYALIPILVLACFIAPAQRIVIAGFDFNFIRIMVLFGFLRVMLRNEHASFTWHVADKLLIAWILVKVVIQVIQKRSFGAIVYPLGQGFEALGIYFIARFVVTSIEDVRNIIRALAILSLPVAVFFLLEKSTGRNVFSVFGGVPEFTMIRDGKLRVQGAFAHPILAGSFWVATIPGILAVMKRNGRLQVFSVGSLAMVFLIIFLCSSSTPIIGVLLSFIGMFFYRFRHQMKTYQKAALLSLVLLQLSMKQPIWHLLGRMDLAGGSTGYYRYQLINQAIRYFWDWCFFGLQSTMYWSAGTGEIMTDMVNQYILEGVEGGIWTMVLFIATIVVCFRAIGRVIASGALSGDDERVLWSLGATLFSHSIMFFVVSYFGQIVMLWNMQLALIVSMELRYASRTELADDWNRSAAVLA